MQLVRIEWIRPRVACVLLTACLLPSGWAAETAHVVSPAELQGQAAKSSQARQENIAKVRGFLSAPAGREALAKAHLDNRQVQTAVAELNDQELAELAARSEQAQKDFSAGYLTTRDIALIILGIALLILIIVVVR